MEDVILVYMVEDGDLVDFNLQPLDPEFFNRSYKFTREVEGVEEGCVERYCGQISRDRNEWFHCQGVAHKDMELVGYWKEGIIHAL